ncbi:High-affinity zinc uptake system binding-protein ZnuA [Geobacillus stearothermophilus]|uniref:metal ABC transporter substrate-binding protein n=1 Tax=Geobacillus sp. DSP4a TaxID=2508873 RepID=UPI00067DC8C2|nr:metal ABC transporter substrate-binding protein [Geobacillus sp. DSP4a]AKU26140.1 adhesin [Geobacillus sp. LC300]KZE96748.1 High-affinity zinc uptake system binding-protein ZnuA [Geobacillus stearothermophilus]NNU98408.1 adhesin [Geobacillus sp. DSP4a]
MRAAPILLSLLLTASALLYGCQSKPENETGTSNDRLTIYTTVYPLEDFTKKIGGDLVEVKSIYPPGAEAHTFEPTTKTIEQIAGADAFIYIGHGMEPFAEKLKETLQNEHVQFLAATNGIELLESNHEEGHEEEHQDEHGEEHEHDHGDKDPHVWLDPIRSIAVAENIRDLLVELNPEKKEQFNQNFAALKAKLERLDGQFRSVIEKAPKKEMLVAHAAYGYWEDRYGLRQLSVSGLSPTNEPSQKELAALIDLAKRHDIRYVLFERNTPAKIAETVQREIGAKALYLHNLESVTDEDRKQGRDYFDLMEENIKTIEQALR